MNRVSDSIDASQSGFGQKQSQPLVTTTHPLIHLMASGKEVSTTARTSSEAASTSLDELANSSPSRNPDPGKGNSSSIRITSLPVTVVEKSTTITGAFQNLKSNLTDDSFDLIVGGIGKRINVTTATTTTQSSLPLLHPHHPSPTASSTDADVDFLTDGDKVCPVKCNSLGSMVPISCDPINKTCKCKPGVTGRNCDRCQSQFWGIHLITSENDLQGCARK